MAARRSSAGSASAGPQAHRSARGPAPDPPVPAPDPPVPAPDPPVPAPDPPVPAPDPPVPAPDPRPPRPAPGAALPPARPAPHTAAVPPHRAHPGPYAPRALTARITRHPGRTRSALARTDRDAYDRGPGRWRRDLESHAGRPGDDDAAGETGEARPAHGQPHPCPRSREQLLARCSAHQLADARRRAVHNPGARGAGDEDRRIRRRGGGNGKKGLVNEITPAVTGPDWVQAGG